jgi:hypothetical protein
LIEDDEYEETFMRLDKDDLLADLNRPYDTHRFALRSFKQFVLMPSSRSLRVDVPIRDADVMNGTLAKTMEREGLIPEGHDEAWEKLKWNSGTYVNCDLRYYNLAALGKFDVVLIDPPWYLQQQYALCDPYFMCNEQFILQATPRSPESV